MNKFLLLLLLIISPIIFSQTPGGVTGEDLWYKTDENTVSNNEFTDFGPNHYEINGNGSIGSELFNFNHSLGFQGGNLKFSYSVENLKVATIFTVYTNPENENWSLIHSEWITGINNGDGNNEKEFSYTAQKLVKEDFTLEYPEDGEPANALVNTLNWFDFHSDHINNNTGSGGESNVFIGKANGNAGAFGGFIPEFIIYRKALSKEERQRVESYLAIKYGITLTPEVNYFNSDYEEIWEEGNNAIFGNRILAIGRDDTSGLYQKQSASSHTENQEIILNVGELTENNDLNTSELNHNQYIFIGDNNQSQGISDSIDISDWQLHRIERKWLVHPYGETTDTIKTELRYNAAHLISKIQQDYEEEDWEDITVWLLIDRSADEQAESGFDLQQCEAYMIDNIEDDHIVYYERFWDEDANGFDQFTFAVGPKMLVDFTLKEMKCTDTAGTIDIELTFGEPNFDFHVYNDDLSVDLHELNWPTRNMTFEDLPNGWYTLEVEDATGYVRTIEFEVSPTAGMFIDLEDEYVLNDHVNASENVTASGISYEWFVDTLSIGHEPEITFDTPGTYTVVLTNQWGCQVSDTTIVSGEGSNKTNDDDTLLNDSLARESIRVYPNPTKANQEFTVEINLLEKQNVQIQVYDFAGSLIYNETLKDIMKYKWHHKIFQSGSYMISVSTKKQKFTKKLIIK